MLDFFIAIKLMWGAPMFKCIKNCI